MVDGSSEPAGVPEDVVPYRRLDTAKRRRAAAVYLVMAALAGWLTLVSDVDLMWITAVVPLVAIAGYQFAGGWHIKVSDMAAISLAAKAASFDFGHGSATLGYRGPLAKPVWQVLIFADGPRPDHQALVTIDGLSGEVTGLFEQHVELP